MQPLPKLSLQANLRRLRRLLILTLLLQGGNEIQAQSSAIAVDGQPYRYQRAVSGLSGAQGYRQISLPPEVVAKLSLTLGDVRLYETSGDVKTEVPYLLEAAETAAVRGEVAFEIMNKSYSGAACFVTLRQRTRKTVNEIVLEFGEDNFDRYLTLEGSLDGAKWLTVAERLRVVSIRNAFVSYTYTTLNFTPSDYPYFRLKIPELKPERVNFRGATVSNFQSPQTSLDTLPVASWKVGTLAKTQQTEVLITLGTLGTLGTMYAVSRIELSFKKGKDFYRTVEASYKTQSAETAKMENLRPELKRDFWQSLTGTIFSSLEPSVIDAPDVRATALRVLINDRDNKPLEITGVRVLAVPQRLIAEFAPQKNYTLHYGKPGDRKPSYDLVYFKDSIPANLASLALGTEEMITQPASQPSQLESKWWLWAVMGVIIIVIGLFSFQMLRSTGPAQE
ncbi:MAG: hypothetical protein IAF08_04045 [Rhizobacter sp.]|nr:hypothetical protein [Chlorobiales bacterium]